MKRTRGFIITPFMIVVLWAVGGYFVVQDAKHCPEVGKTIHMEKDGTWACR